MLEADVLKAQRMDSLGTIRIMWCPNGQRNSQGKQFFVSWAHTLVNIYGYCRISWNVCCVSGAGVTSLLWWSTWCDGVTYQASAFKLPYLMTLLLNQSEAIWDSSVITNPEAIHHDWPELSDRGRARDDPDCAEEGRRAQEVGRTED